MPNNYDAIIVGARCAGAPLAMLLARRGYRVLLVDKAQFGSDTISTNVIHPVGVSYLARWGLLDKVVRSGCPAIHTYRYDFGPVAIEGSPAHASSPVAYAPRRTVLDKILVEAAAASGAEVRESYCVDALLVADDRVVGIRNHDGVERSTVVVGADGRWSRVAELVDAPRYNQKPTVLAPYYCYWSNLPMNGCFETYVHPRRGFAAVPTNDGLTLTVAGWPMEEFAERKHDLPGSFRSTFEISPEFADRLRGAQQETRLVGMPTPNFFRKPYGPGWVLVGDAGYVKDPITAFGISDAFRDAESCAAALASVFDGRRTLEDAMSRYTRMRDAHALPFYEMTWQIATLAPPPPEMHAIITACQGNQFAMDAFVRMNAGGLPPAEFFEHVVPAAMAAFNANEADVSRALPAP
ncbi:MAG: FAD-dependent monooxygenase [Myxococcota bacterium]|nr:FAD-dependent monooxygenase [Deltaproteobacteria bacterium]MDQ3337613.1 FAD-dependent monooxygenase [Myxococcota bacterium]